VDRHEPSHDRDDAAYAQFMLEQLRELLSNYGPICEIWFDGMWAKMPQGWRDSQEALLRTWREVGAKRWHWDELYAEVKRLQPQCIVLNNTTTAHPGVPTWPVDARPGEKATSDTADQTIWNIEGREVYLPLQIETTMSQKGPPGDFEQGSWFWHPWDHAAATVEMVRRWRADAEKRNAVLLINVGPMANGKLRDEDLATLRGLSG